MVRLQRLQVLQMLLPLGRTHFRWYLLFPGIELFYSRPLISLWMMQQPFKVRMLISYCLEDGGDQLVRVPAAENVLECVGVLFFVETPYFRADGNLFEDGLNTQSKCPVRLESLLKGKRRVVTG